MRMAPFLLLLLAAKTGAAAEPGRHEMPAAGVEAVVEKLFELGDKCSLESLRAAQAFYRSLSTAERRDGRVQYAYAVVLIHQKRLGEASETLDQMIDSGWHDAAVRRAQIWVELALDHRSAALDHVVALRRELSASHEPQLETAEFLGRVSGFVERLEAAKFSAADGRRWRDALNRDWTEAEQAVFDRARAGVLDSARRLFDANEQFQKQTEQARTKKLEDARRQHDRRATALAEKQQKLADTQAKRTAEAKTKSEAIDDHLDEVAEKREALLQEMAPLAAQQVMFASQMLPQPPAPLFGSRLGPSTIWQYRVARAVFFHNARVERMMTPLAVQLNVLGGQLTQLGDADLELAAEQWQTDWKYGSEMSKLALEKARLDHQQRRVEHGAKRLQAISSSYSTRLRIHAGPLTRFTTYVPFLYERERARLRTMLKNESKP